MSNKHPEAEATCSELVWTRNRPKVPGWYWLSAPVGYTPRIVRVWESSEGLTVEAERGNFWPLKKRGGWKGCKWAGPIPFPNVKLRRGADREHLKRTDHE